MATQADQSTSVEPRQMQSTVSTSSASSPKVSIFGKKAGFVIPKNKLSGSLVPFFRGSGKNESGSNVKEESTKQVQRKTKWGADLTLDPAVRKARVLAYQTRVEQIMKQLNSGALEIGENEGSLSPLKVSNSDDASDQTAEESKKLELLEHERREIIGELIQLNPGYKAPADYRPLLKETKVPIPTKTHPGHNIIGLLLGPESNTQKRLQEETGAKIQVYGIKKATGEKSEITQAGINEAQGAYEDLYIDVSADTYDKVDAAVALIELLLTPVTVSSAAAPASTAASSTVPSADVNPAAVQPLLATAQPGLLPYQPYPAPWFSAAQPTVPSMPSSGAMLNPLPNNSFQLQPPIGSFNMPTYSGQPPHMNSMSRPPLVFPGPQPSMQAMQQPQPPYPVTPSQSSSMGPPFGCSQANQSSVVPPLRPPMTVNPQPTPIAPAGPLPGGLLQTPHASGGWPMLSPVSAQSQRPPQMISPFVPLRPSISVSPVAANPPSTSNSVASGPQLAIHSVSSQPNTPTSAGGQPPLANFSHPAAFPSRPSTGPQAFPSITPQFAPSSIPALSSSPSVVPSHAPNLSPMQVRPPMPSPAPSPVLTPMQGPHTAAQAGTMLAAPASVLQQASTPHSMGLVPAPPQAPVSSMPPLQAPTGAQPPVPSLQSPPVVVGSSSGSMSGFPPLANTSTVGTPTSMAASRLPPPFSGDFTFQPIRPPAVLLNPSRPTSQMGLQANVPLGAPQALSFRPANQGPAPPVQHFQRPLDVNQMGPPRMPILPPHSSAPFLRNPAAVGPPAGIPAFPPNHMRSLAPTVQVGSLSFSSTALPSNLPNSFPNRPVQFLPPQQHPLTDMNRPTGLVAPNHPFGQNPHGGVAGIVSLSRGGNQIYDPFLPTAVSVAPRRQPGDANIAKKPEADPEYEDLMASVGVKY